VQQTNYISVSQGKRAGISALPVHGQPLTGATNDRQSTARPLRAI